MRQHGPSRHLVAEIDGEWLYGRGAEDMKAAIACFVQAVEESGFDGSKGSISLLITGG